MRRTGFRHQQLNITAFLSLPSTVVRPLPCEFELASAALQFPSLNILAAQPLWSLPVGTDMLAHCRRSRNLDLLLLRDMHDRDPLKSVRCDISLVWDRELLIFRDMMPAIYDGLPPALLSIDSGTDLIVTAFGLAPATHLSGLSRRNRLMGIETATHLLRGTGLVWPAA